MIHNVFIGEFLGSFTLIVFGAGVVANVLLTGSKGENSGWIVIATGWFVAVVLGVFVAQAAGSSNADINPAVSLAKYFLGFYTLSTLFKITLCQVLGCFTGAIVVFLAYLSHWKPTKNPEFKRLVFCTSPAIRHLPGNMLNEIIGTFMLVFCVGAIFGQAAMVHPVSGLGPYLVGVIVWGIGLSLGGATGYAINPARDLGPRIAHALLPLGDKASSDWSYSLIPMVGPLIGALLGAMAWRFLF